MDAHAHSMSGIEIREKKTRSLSLTKMATPAPRVFEVYFLLKHFQGALIASWARDGVQGDDRLRLYFDDLNNVLLDASETDDIVDRAAAYTDALAGGDGFKLGDAAIAQKAKLRSQVDYVLQQYGGRITHFNFLLQTEFNNPAGYSVINVRSGLQAEQKFGGIAASTTEQKRTGGETYNYVATRPFVKTTKKEKTCATQQRLVRGPGYWSVLCERTGRDGVNRCKLHRIDEQNNRLVYVPCESTQVQVLKGAQVDVISGANGVIQQTVQPLVDKYETVRSLPARDSGVEFEKLQRVGAIDGVVGPKWSGAPSLGGTTEQKLKHGGSVNLPDPKTLFKKQFVLNDLDVRDAQARLPDGTIAQPNEWADLDPLPPGVEYYSYDDHYGTSAINNRKKGFDFKFKFMSLETEQNKAYLQWLIGVAIKMRIDHWQDFDFLYDPSVDTIATLEANILNGLAKLEARKQFFNRRKLFAGAEPYRSSMHDILEVYAFAPPTEVWISPMSARYIDLPEKNSPSRSENEGKTQALLQDALNTLRSALNGGTGGFTDEQGGMIVFPDFQIYLADAQGDNDTASVGVLEAELMSTLARLQFKLGFVVNFSFDFGRDYVFENVFMANGVKKFLGADLKRYIDAFSSEDNDQRFLIRLPELRLDQAQASGVKLPPSTIPNTRKAFRDLADVPSAVTDVVVAPGGPGAIVAIQG